MDMSGDIWLKVDVILALSNSPCSLVVRSGLVDASVREVDGVES
jgi:hypothetical protein